MPRSPLPGPGSASLAPTTLYSLDLTAEPEQAGIAAGDFEIGGLTWTLAQSTADPTCDLVQGSGLVLTSADGDADWVAAVTVPLYELGVADYVLRRRVVVSARLVSTFPSADASLVGFGVTSSNGVSPDCGTWVGRLTVGGDAMFVPYTNIGGTEYPALGSRTYADDLTHDVYQVAYDSVVRSDLFSGEWGDDWPYPGDMRSRSASQAPVDAVAMASPPGAADLLLSVYVSKHLNAAGEPMSVTLSHLKVEVY